MAKRSAPKKVVQQSVAAGPSTGLLFLGMFLVILGVFLGLSFATADVHLDPREAAPRCATGLLGAWAAFGVILTFGRYAAFLLAGLVSAWGIHVAHRNRFWGTWPRVLGGLIMLSAVSLLCSSTVDNQVLPGGLLGKQLGPPAVLYMGEVGMVIVMLAVLFVGAVLAFGQAVLDAGRACGIFAAKVGKTTASGMAAAATGAADRLRPAVASALTQGAQRALVLVEKPPQLPASSGRSRRKSTVRPDNTDDRSAVEVEAAVVEEPIASPEPDLSVDDDDEAFEAQTEMTAAEAEAAAPVAPPPPMPPQPDFTPYGVGASPLSGEPEEFASNIIFKEPKPKKKPAKIDKVEVDMRELGADYQLPPLNLLQEPVQSEGEGRAQLEKRGKVLEQTLAEFKIEGRVVQIECGPRVTLFEMTLAPGIKLSRVSGLADNISMALKAPTIRIIAPIPGKDTIGIEVPNNSQELVTLREVLASIDRQKRKQVLPLCLGKDVSGTPVVADLARMPHLLIAGATGSGKSVCINSVLLSFLMCCRPQDVKLILIDPKVVELSRFKDVPHLLSPVVTDMKRAVGILEWACQQMDERYEQLSMVGVNNISKFNSLGENEVAKRLGEAYNEEELALFPKHLPYIVIIIDELADLMMVSGKEVEQHITRLAAKSRAVGIHLILATQRPSVDVITGLIKANMPSRIAFQVSSKVDSRTILDQNGAETLLGAGDMLYLPPGVGKVARSQGVFVSDEELFQVVDFCRSQMKPQYHADLEGPVIGGAAAGDVEDFDEYFVEAGRAIIESGRGSVSLLQRKLGIGYGRASRIIDQLASIGVLGPFREGKAREILLTMEEFDRQYGGAGKQMSFSDVDDEGGLAGLRDDERAPDSLPWDDDEA